MLITKLTITTKNQIKFELKPDGGICITQENAKIYIDTSQFKRVAKIICDEIDLSEIETLLHRGATREEIKKLKEPI